MCCGIKANIEIQLFSLGCNTPGYSAVTPLDKQSIATSDCPKKSEKPNK